jgi:hypothetical protein
MILENKPLSPNNQMQNFIVNEPSIQRMHMQEGENVTLNNKTAVYVKRGTAVFGVVGHNQSQIGNPLEGTEESSILPPVINEGGKRSKVNPTS